MIMNEPREQSPRNGAVAESSRALAECLSFLDEGDPAYRDCSLPRYDHSHGKREGEGPSLHPQALGEGPPLQQVCSQRKPAWVRTLPPSPVCAVQPGLALELEGQLSSLPRRGGGKHNHTGWAGREAIPRPSAACLGVLKSPVSYSLAVTRSLISVQ